VHGNNEKDWKIRSQTPKFAWQNTEKVQRLQWNGS